MSKQMSNYIKKHCLQELIFCLVTGNNVTCHNATNLPKQREDRKCSRLNNLYKPKKNK